MSNKSYLVLDCDYLCHRAKYAMKDLSTDSIPTGVIYGFLKDIITFTKMFHTKNIIFCWDSKHSIRQKMYPAYKQNRRDKEKTEEEECYDAVFRKQIKKLRRIYLPMIGFKNIFIQKGYESDDIIASICYNIFDSYNTIIISADQDLYQLLTIADVSIYNPQQRKMMTRKTFQKKYNITPDRWTCVKAIAGCTSDNVKGIKGIGNKTAIAYLKDELKRSNKAFEKIKAFCWNKKLRPFFLTNLEIVSLPLKGTKIFKIQKDELSEHGWKIVIKKLGIKSLLEKFPFERK